jgi:serine/threonine protein phosphatase PrpC
MVVEQLMPYKLLRIEHITEKGNRLRNEDYVLKESWEPGISLVLIADGMGGYEDGDIAAKTISQSIYKFFKANFSLDKDINKQIKDALSSANQAIYKIKAINGKKLGATLAGIIFTENSAICFWLGDVRIIHFIDYHIHFQSRDHSLVNELKAQNTNINAGNLKRINHIVTRAIQGNQEIPEPEIQIIEKLSDLDRFLICSDGVHNVVGPKELEQLLVKSPTLEAFIDAVKKKCEEHGDDNYSAALISM